MEPITNYEIVELREDKYTVFEFEGVKYLCDMTSAKKAPSIRYPKHKDERLLITGRKVVAAMMPPQDESLSSPKKPKRLGPKTRKKIHLEAERVKLKAVALQLFFAQEEACFTTKGDKYQVKGSPAIVQAEFLAFKPGRGYQSKRADMADFEPRTERDEYLYMDEIQSVQSIDTGELLYCFEPQNY